MNPDEVPDFARLATQELITSGDIDGPEGIAARHRARTWAMMDLAQAIRFGAAMKGTTP